ncbi:MAG TPA: hypothetical protein VNN22_12150 [Verrucomicrobiae bacterium]|nr:hypothetical protein [Verrucomicrobiae bacterium]
MHADESILPGSCKIIAASIPGRLVSHVLSIGLIAKLDDHAYFSEGADQVLAAVYSPLSLWSPIPGADEFFNWHIFHCWNCDNMSEMTF